ncbi:ATP-binding cassette domain-containing protein [Macrococcus hajekii]|uniref:ATP-binding cassette domain-containing protein n=1 Tax=Macrococcus hajekii TaxID=198482 RepID=A0A4R6BJU6_9STAP|nr:AAA family ATPase [Macrococcus hajekii]TDM01975.1 ATP-binding cassette domain-containing protein [Macrococcus hajekii]GGB08978.1 hypothetical protein GCM10007190_16280 [Macrococcus hajekii]
MFIKQITSNFNYDNLQYWHDIPAIKNMNTLKFTQPVTLFIGENGSGKSTLIEAIAVHYGMNAEGGGRNFNFSTQDTHSNLDAELRIGKLHMPEDTYFLRAEGFYNLASNIDSLGDIINSYGGKSLHHQSHGESFLALMQHRFRKNGLYILDEPESALSPMRQMNMLVRMHELVMQGCQFIIATHSPILMTYPDAEIIEFNDTGMTSVNYQETDHYLITKAFIERPKMMIDTLLNEE